MEKQQSKIQKEEYKPIKISQILLLQDLIKKDQNIQIIKDSSREENYIENYKNLNDIKISQNLDSIKYKNCSLEQQLQTDKNEPHQSNIFFGLCHCPGKQLKMGRDGKPHNRNIIEDITYFKNLNQIQVIICLLNKYELRSIGVDYNKFQGICEKQGVQFLELPIIEMGEPEISFQEFYDFIDKNIIQNIKNKKNVIAHCRGGIGRAGLLAACTLIQCNISQNATQAINMVRKIRDKRCVESRKQEDYVKKYQLFLKGLEGLN
ncbi:hypothetical protein PPERSA_11592 [Pseudocohnilembus persalinus]|uniref:Tyrosine specific protein phosphatases domain-containing protein n=1 Tax=Pseudocohnilembus persalinus TaxID=266149 RepID=A0A0V0QA20_PSEPJ|nr:hypothetical protein PPERSA_11592 [Pseudocohnilembus persalinus]|eukprot:KRW98991.1 hypothetical protein PPERSA_11592 [Pseudocohnilembus persalinus]